jgi:hypothetical protein
MGKLGSRGFSLRGIDLKRGELWIENLMDCYSLEKTNL